MPIYLYRCSNQCGEFEAVQKITDEPYRSCPKCGCYVTKLVAPCNFVLNGPHWPGKAAKSGKSTD